MSSNMVDIIISNALQQANQRRAEANALRREVGVSLFQGWLNGLTSARTPADARKSTALFSKAIENATKDLPGGAIKPFSDQDLLAIERMLEQDGQLASEVYDIGLKNVGGMLTGKVTPDDAIAGIQDGIRGLTEKYGAAEVAAQKGETYSLLLEALKLQKQYDTSRINLMASLRPDANALLRFMPDTSPLIVNFEATLDATAFADAALHTFGTTNLDQTMLQAWMLSEGARVTGLASSPEQARALGTDPKNEALRAGERLWNEKLETYRAERRDQFYKITLPTIQQGGRAQVEQMSDLLRQWPNEALGADVFNRLNLDIGPIIQATEDARAKFETGQPTPREMDMIPRVVNTLRRSGLLDVSGVNYSKMPEDEWLDAVQSGQVEGAMRNITGPNGKNLWSMIVNEETGLVRPNADRLITLDHDKLAKGDPIAWDVADFLSGSSDPGAFLTDAPDGKGKWSIWRALDHAQEKDGNSLAERTEGAIQQPVNPVATYEAADFMGPGRVPPLGAANQARPQRVTPEEIIGALDDATVRGIQSGDDSFAKFHDTMFGETTNLTSTAFSDKLTDITRSFARDYERSQTVEQRLNSLRGTMSRKLLGFFPDTQAEESAAKLEEGPPATPDPRPTQPTPAEVARDAAISDILRRSQPGGAPRDTLAQSAGLTPGPIGRR